MMTYGSLFAGIGGFDLGLEQAGMRAAWNVEREPTCRKLLASKFPHAEQFDDVCTVGEANLKPVDLICGGFPCQDLSVAGKRAGLAGERSGLFYQLTRITNELQPAFLLWENVPGLLTSDEGRDFARVLMELDRIGYHGAWRVLDAQYFGVAQRRRRVFGLFARGDTGAERCAQILSLTEGMRGHPAPRRETGQDAAGTLSARTEGGGGLGTDFECSGGLQLAGTLNDGARPGSYNGQDAYNDLLLPVTHTLRAEGFDASEDGTGRGTPLVPIAINLRGREGGAMPETSDKASLRAASGGSSRSYVAFSSKDHGADAGEIAPTLRSMGHKESHMNGGGQVAVAMSEVAQPLRSNPHNNSDPGMEATMHILHGMGVRRLTPRECERLQGFPDDWTDGFSDSVRYRMLGNAVAVHCARWIGSRIRQHNNPGQRIRAANPQQDDRHSGTAGADSL